jgi:hypothetical protein
MDLVKKPAAPKKVKKAPLGYGAAINSPKVHRTALTAINEPKVQRNRWKKVG